MTSEDHQGAFVDVCVLSEPRANEMDFDMTQATRDMPRVRVVGDQITLAQAVQTAIDTLDDTIEVIAAYRRTAYGDDRIRYVVLPDADTDDATAVAWTMQFNEPIYGVRSNGSLVADDGFHENITIGDLSRSAGQFGNGANDRVVLVAPTGLGDASVYHDVTMFLLDHWLEYAVAGSGALTTLRKAMLRRTMIRAARRTAQAMLHAAVAQPWQLRRFIDTQTEWQLSRFAKLMQIPPADAARLLRGVGYEPRGDVWERSETGRARRARRHWMRDESRRAGS